jgi:hypothetical protein
MKYKILVNLLFLTSVLVSCQEKKVKIVDRDRKDIKENSITLLFNKNVSIMLEKQIECGKPSFDNPYQYSEKDLEITSPILTHLLTDNGYKQISNEKFIGKIKLIFNRIIDRNSSSNYLYINFLTKCNKATNYIPNNAENNGVFVMKKLNFITELYPLPSIIEYQKAYAEVAQEENNISKTYNDANGNKVSKYLWKDVPNLKEIRKKNIQTIVARNMYLFNDNKAQFKWLILNDEYFMESLVKTFGYTEDSELLKWVVEKTKFNKNDPQDYGKLFWTKQCDGTLKLHANTFKVLQKLYISGNDPSDNRFILDNIKNYLEYLGDIEKSQNENLTPIERVKIMSNLAYFAEQYNYDKNFNDDNKMMARLRYFLSDKDVESLKKNNYFNLPKFKEWYDNADYDEYYVRECEYGGSCGKDNQPMNIAEWRKQHPKK